MADAPRILMCPADHFSVDYSINPWMDPAGWARAAEALTATAKAEWRALHRTLQQLGAAIELMPPVPALPDLVFTANAAVVMDGKALLARFRYPERRREEIHFERTFRALQAAGIIDCVKHLPEGIVLEGAGDCVWDQRRRLFWMGYGPRSDAAARQAVEAAFGLETVALALADPRFYHMDTALRPLPGGEVMYVPEGFAEEALSEIRDRVEPHLRIELGEEDAAALAANGVCLGDSVVLCRCTARLRRRLKQHGYRVRTTPLFSFRRSGGSAFCLTLRLDHRSDKARAPTVAPIYATGNQADGLGPDLTAR